MFENKPVVKNTFWFSTTSLIGSNLVNIRPPTVGLACSTNCLTISLANVDAAASISVRIGEETISNGFVGEGGVGTITSIGAGVGLLGVGTG